MVYASHLLKDEEMRQVVEATDVGIESIEFSISENLDCLNEKIVEYIERLEYIGTRNLTLHGPFLDLNPMAYDSMVRAVTKARFTQTYEAAKRLGAKKIIFHTGFVPGVYYLTDWANRMAEFWNEFMEGKSGVQILMENVYDKEISPMIEVEQKVESPDFKLCLDIGHAHCYSPRSLSDWIQTFGEHAGHVHIHDNCGDRDSHLGLGRGNIPIDETLEMLMAYMPDADYTIECSIMEDVLMSGRAVSSCREKMQSAMKTG